MKKLLAVLLTLGSFATYALEECSVEVKYNPKTQEIDATLTKSRDASYLNVLGHVKPCELTYLELAKEGNLTTDVAGEAITINYIFPQSLIGTFHDGYLGGLISIRNSRDLNVRIAPNQDIIVKNK